jgi:hypothetical protein
MQAKKQTASGLISTLALFGSFSTLFCCALPALLVSIGAGAAVIGLVSAFPQLIWLSEHKEGLFIFAGIMLTLSGVMRYLTRNAPCPADPAKAKACMRMRRISLGVFVFSLCMYLIGLYFAFIAVHLM